MTPAQCRAARGLLNWSQKRLAEKAKVSYYSISDYELERPRPVSAKVLTAIKRALEKAGVEFTNGKRPGVRMGR